MEKTVKGITVEEYNELIGYRRMVNEHAVKVYVAGEGYLFFDGSEALEKAQKIADSFEKNIEDLGKIRDLEEQVERHKKFVQDLKDRYEKKEQFYLEMMSQTKQMSIWEFIKWRKK